MDKNSYALGMSIAHNMMSSGIMTIEFDDFAAGVKAILTGAEPAISFQEAGELLDKYFAELEAAKKAEVEAMSAAMKEEGEAFLAANKAKEGVITLPSGLQYQVIKDGQHLLFYGICSRIRPERQCEQHAELRNAEDGNHLFVCQAHVLPL